MDQVRRNQRQFPEDGDQLQAGGRTVRKGPADSPAGSDDRGHSPHKMPEKIAFMFDRLRDLAAAHDEDLKQDLSQ